MDEMKRCVPLVNLIAYGEAQVRLTELFDQKAFLDGQNVIGLSLLIEESIRTFNFPRIAMSDRLRLVMVKYFDFCISEAESLMRGLEVEVGDE